MLIIIIQLIYSRTHPYYDIVDLDAKCLLCCVFELGEEHGSHLDRCEGLFLIHVTNHNTSASVWQLNSTVGQRG